MMPPRAQLRLENALLADVLNGHYDIYAPIKLKGGVDVVDSIPSKLQ